MNLNIPSSANSAEKNKEWMKKHPILTGVAVLFLIGVIANIFGDSSQSQTSNDVGIIETQSTEPEQVSNEVVPESIVVTNTDSVALKEKTSVTSDNNAKTTEPTQSASIEQKDLYVVTDVVDGDTIKISIDGKIETLRLIGIDTPEIVDPRKPVQCFGKEASNMAKQLLSGQKVRIESDVTQDTRDKYGRLLVYIVREDGLFFNKHMIAEGYAYEYTYSTAYKYQSEFNSAEESARTSGKGLWSSNTCAGDPLTGTEVKTVTPIDTTPVTNTSSAKYYTSSYYSAKYYYPEDCDGWKGLSASNLKIFNTLEELLAQYSRTKSPECN